ncbi:MAG TPA: DUF5666 domain-containing protein, partial [Candidatus Sulfotelmatobacter sp.]|nr:DUF5666 domain-containing protein [Candidatus Sulfotelmatobacter sp.]
MRRSLLKVAIGCALFTAMAYAQTSDAGSAMVSPAGNMQPENIQPGTPPPAERTEESAIVADPASLIPDLPPVPAKKATLVGGTLERLDRVRDQLTVQVFGGGRVRALFDPRTRVFRGQKEVTIADLKQGERIYLDTILDGDTVFARNIRLSPEHASGQSQGILLKYTSDELTIRDGLSPSAVRIRVSPTTKFMREGQPVAAGALKPGSLIAVEFDSQGNGRNLAREISILALPGTRYTFVGQVVHLDLRAGLLVLNSSIDHKTYEIYLNPQITPDDNLHAGTNVTITANFENSRYVANHV